MAQRTRRGRDHDDAVRADPAAPTHQQPQPAGGLLDLQGSAGNRATAAVARSLAVGAADDRAETDADALAAAALARVADSPAVRRMATSTGGSEAGRAGGPVSPSTSGALAAAQARGGRPLDTTVRSTMEHGFGRTLPSVRVHTGSTAAELARGFGARAFTIDRDIFFGNRQYDPSTPDGRYVLAHELAHVVQQSAGSQLRRIGDEKQPEPIHGTGHSVTPVLSTSRPRANSRGRRAPERPLLNTIAPPAAAPPGAAAALRSMPEEIQGPTPENLPAAFQPAARALEAAKPNILKALCANPSLVPVHERMLSNDPRLSGLSGDQRMYLAAIFNWIRREVPTAREIRQRGIDWVRQGKSHEAGLMMAASVPQAATEPWWASLFMCASWAFEVAGDLELAEEFARKAGRRQSVYTHTKEAVGDYGKVDIATGTRQEEASGVAYLKTTAQRQRFQLHTVGNKLFQNVHAPPTEPYDTGGAATLFSRGGAAIFVLTPAGAVYASWQAKDRTHHSSLMAGGDVAGAGEIVVRGGHLAWLSNQSGHYHPQYEHLNNSLDAFQRLGQPLDKVDLAIYTPWRVQVQWVKGGRAFMDVFAAGAVDTAIELLLQSPGAAITAQRVIAEHRRRPAAQPANVSGNSNGGAPNTVGIGSSY
ncbi:MAG TPA: DUF4157 domain-containing protein [Acidimicrobiia bacterium]|nr:DUF4157 domain-containing protein [Acidimicrobiia bacterium]